MIKRNVIKRNFSPLRYPGGKGKLADYLKSIVETNDLFDCQYVEPYAGGAAVAIELLAHEYVLSAHINDISRPIHSFWSSVLDDAESFCRLVRDTKVSVRTWDKQKSILTNMDSHDTLEVGFATFFLNRTNRSGILNAGIIGGRKQQSEWGIDARYNKDNLIRRIQMINNLRDRIVLSKLDAAALIAKHAESWKQDCFIYFDPPYYNKGQHLYYNFYNDEDHEFLAREISKLKNHSWVVSYDNHKRIRKLFESYKAATYDIGYSASEHKDGREIMLFSPSLEIPKPIRTMRNFRKRKAA